MNQELIKGQKITLGEINKFNVGINWDQSSFLNYEIDASIILLSDRDKLEEESNFIFYNNPKSTCSSVILNEDNNNYKKNIEIDLNKIPIDVSRLVFVLTIDNGDSLNHRFGNIKDITFDLCDKNSNLPLYKYSVDQLTNETAIIIVEIYKHNSIWKLQTTGNGFNSGLDKILSQYASDKVKVHEEQSVQEIQEKVEEIQKIDVKVEKDETNKNTSISLIKVNLEKKGDSTKFDLSKSKKIEKIYAKLFWKKGVDLDVHAFYKNKNGKKGHVYFATKGYLNKEPFIMLDKDSGVGNTSGNNQENITISDLKHFDFILFSVNIFRFFFRRGENFAKYDGKVILETDRGDQISVPLTSEEIGTWFVIAMLDNSNPNEPRIVNINQVLKSEPVIENFQNL